MARKATTNKLKTTKPKDPGLVHPPKKRVKKLTNADALARVILELEEIIRETWFVPKRVRKAIERAYELARHPEVAKALKDRLLKRRIL